MISTQASLEEDNIDFSILYKLDIFGLFNDEELKKIFDFGSIKTYPKNSNIVIEGDISPVFYLVLNGKVGLFKTLKDGEEKSMHLISVLEENDCFGEISLVQENLPKNFTLSSLSKVTAFILKKEEFEKLFASNLELELKFHSSFSYFLSKRLNSLSDDLVESYQKLWKLSLEKKASY